MKKMSKKMRVNLINIACIKAVDGYTVPILKLSEISKAAGRALDEGGDLAAMIAAARAATELVGTPA